MYEQPIMNLVPRDLREDEDVSDDQKDDEKADVNENDDLLPMMPLTGTQNDIAADPDSDDNVMVGFPTQDGVLNSDQDQAPAHGEPANRPQDGGRTIVPARQHPEENDRARPCCNIL
jgi:hypothetical protein